MELIKQPSIFIVKSKYDCEGYEENREYRFMKIEDVLNFLNGEMATDVCGDRHYLNYYELVVEVYEKTEYELDWELENENDNCIWTVQ